MTDEMVNVTCLKHARPKVQKVSFNSYLTFTHPPASYDYINVQELFNPESFLMTHTSPPYEDALQIFFFSFSLLFTGYHG